MNISPQGVHLIASFEGWRPGWYDDGTGVKTIGYGHTGPLPVGWKPPLTITQGLELLKADATKAVASVNAGVKVSLGILPPRRQARFDACVSLAFNIGGGAFQSSSLLREINREGAPRDWAPCGPLWLEWSYAGDKFLPGLHARRVREFAIFASGVYPPV